MCLAESITEGEFYTTAFHLLISFVFRTWRKKKITRAGVIGECVKVWWWKKLLSDTSDTQITITAQRRGDALESWLLKLPILLQTMAPACVLYVFVCLVIYFSSDVDNMKKNEKREKKNDKEHFFMLIHPILWKSTHTLTPAVTP